MTPTPTPPSSSSSSPGNPHSAATPPTVPVPPDPDEVEMTIRAERPSATTKPKSVPITRHARPTPHATAKTPSSRPQATMDARRQGDSTRPTTGGGRPQQTLMTSSDSGDRPIPGTMLYGTAHTEGFAKFDLGDVLGRGGMGFVRLAHDRELRRDLAIKLLSQATSDNIQQFIDEAQITGQLEHPNIVPVYELGFDRQGRPWLAMKRVQGVTLMSAIDRRKPTDDKGLSAEAIGEMLDIIGKIGDAIAFAHDRHVIHRDLKPDNIMVGEFGEVLVMDWGLAKPLAHADGPDATADGDGGAVGVTPTGGSGTGRDSGVSAPTRRIGTQRRDRSAQQTLDGTILGTPAYMAPEQAEGRIEEIGPRTDIFALGAILYHLLTGEAPYHAARLEQVLVMAAMCKLVAPRQRAPHRQIPSELEAIVMKAMAADPADRYPSVAAFQADLKAYRAFLPISAKRSTVFDRLVKWSRRHPMATMASAMSLAFVAVLSVVAGILTTQMAEERSRVADERARGADQARIAAQERMRAAEQARIAAQEREERVRLEEENRRGELREMLQKNQITDLRVALGMQMSAERDAALDEFRALSRDAERRERLLDEYISELGAPKIAEFIAAFDRLFEAHEKHGIEVTAADYAHRGILKQLGLGKHAEAIPDYTKALELDPELPMPRHNRAAAYFETRRFAEAMADYDRILADDPSAVQSLHGRGLVKQATGDYRGAREDFSKAIGYQPGNALFYTSRGILEAELGNASAAIADYGRAIAADPRHAQAYFNRGVLRGEAGETASALADYNAAIAIDRNYTKAYFNRGVCHSQQGNYRAALADYDRVLELTPDDLEVRVNRTVVWLELDNFDAAHADIDYILARNRMMWQAYVLRAATYYYTGHVEDARIAFAQALDVAPNNAHELIRRKRREMLGE